MSNNATIKERLNEVYKTSKSLWNSSKYFRIISIVTGSVTISWLIRNIYLKYYRKYYNLPPGPYGIPLIGQIFNLINPTSFCELGKNKCMISICLGPIINMIIINNPYLVKQIYASPFMLDRYNGAIFGDLDDTMFININGEQWQKRRKIIYSNLMSTMKASFIERATKTFIKNKVFTIFDNKIKNNDKIELKPLLRPLGFNLILQACFGQELETLDDPFWIQFDKLLQELGTNQIFQSIIRVFCGGNNKLSKYLEYLFGIKDCFGEMMKLIDEFVSNDKYNIKRDKTDEYNKDIKLFNDYICQYTENNNQLTKKHLYGDMTMMFFAATDTTYSALSFALLMAAKYPSIQEELYNELSDVFDKDIHNITLRNGGLLKIHKLRAFIHEILRIHPPVFVAGSREINVDEFEIDTREFGGNRIYKIPKQKCSLLINTMSIHHNPKWWIKDYDPNNNIKHKNINMTEIHMEFWLDSNGKFNKSENAFLLLAFSRGKRDCVGQSLAMKELYIVLAMIFMRYKVYGPDGSHNFNIKRVIATVMEPKTQTVTLELR